ncbi:MAG TPA: hypothetical protein VFX55_09375 [Duganella sp.]|nr:hypothetical protein [Duganella sp.]
MSNKLKGLRTLLKPISAEAYARLIENSRQEAKEVPDMTPDDIKLADKARLGKATFAIGQTFIVEAEPDRPYQAVNQLPITKVKYLTKLPVKKQAKTEADLLLFVSSTRKSPIKA